MIKRHLPSPKSWPSALLAVLCVAALVGALTGATRPLSAAQFAQTGHWVYNSLLQMVFHIDGGTTNIDAQVPLQGQPGSQVVQGDTSGYVVGPGTITEFGKDSLAVQQTITPPADEVPLGIEVVGGPYLVFRNAGKIVRLGDPTATVSVGGAVGTPVVTEDGTMWLHRPGNGSICTLPRDARDISGCPVTVPGDHAGAMTMVDGRPAFIDLFTSTLHMIDRNTLGAGIPLGVALSPNSRPATQDLAGRVAILDPQRPSLLLVDTKSPAAKSVTVALPPGEYDGPVSTGDVVALVDRRTGTVMTYGADGARKDEKPIKQKAGTPRLSRGEDDRVYVEDADGTQVLVVAKDGNVQDVTVTGKPTAPTPSPGNNNNQPDARGGPSVDQQRGRGEQQQRPTTPPAVPAGRPGAPASVSAAAGNGSATVNWAAASDNRAPITSYQVSWRASTGQTGAMTVGGGAGRTTVNGLTNGVSYVFTVTATNRVGTGPGASSGPATPNAPVSPAAAPVNLNATYDVDDRPTRDVTLSWGRPALNGGTLVHYEVTGTGLATRQVTGTTVTYPQLEAANTYTFTVRAVTRTSAGQTLTGAPASRTVRDTPAPTPKVTISKGGASDTANCDPPACRWVNATMSGFAPNQNYQIRLSSNANNNVRTEDFTTNASGGGSYNQLNYDVPGMTVWVTVLVPGNPVRSNSIRW